MASGETPDQLSTDIFVGNKSLGSAVRKLNSRDRRLIRQYYIHGKTAKDLGIADDEAKELIKTATNNLRAAVFVAEPETVKLAQTEPLRFQGDPQGTTPPQPPLEKVREIGVFRTEEKPAEPEVAKQDQTDFKKSPDLSSDESMRVKMRKRLKKKGKLNPSEREAKVSKTLNEVRKIFPDRKPVTEKKVLEAKVRKDQSPVPEQPKEVQLSDYLTSLNKNKLFILRGDKYPQYIYLGKKMHESLNRYRDKYGVMRRGVGVIGIDSLDNIEIFDRDDSRDKMGFKPVAHVSMGDGGLRASMNNAMGPSTLSKRPFSFAEIGNLLNIKSDVQLAVHIGMDENHFLFRTSETRLQKDTSLGGLALLDWSEIPTLAMDLFSGGPDINAICRYYGLAYYKAKPGYALAKR